MKFWRGDMVRLKALPPPLGTDSDCSRDRAKAVRRSSMVPPTSLLSNRSATPRPARVIASFIWAIDGGGGGGFCLAARCFARHGSQVAFLAPDVANRPKTTAGGRAPHVLHGSSSRTGVRCRGGDLFAAGVRGFGAGGGVGAGAAGGGPASGGVEMSARSSAFSRSSSAACVVSRRGDGVCVVSRRGDGLRLIRGRCERARATSTGTRLATRSSSPHLLFSCAAVSSQSFGALGFCGRRLMRWSRSSRPRRKQSCSKVCFAFFAPRVSVAIFRKSYMLSMRENESHLEWRKKRGQTRSANFSGSQKTMRSPFFDHSQRFSFGSPWAIW